MSQELLFTVILTSKTQLNYVKEFQRLSFSSLWSQIQFSKQHLKIWSMSETDQATIIMSVILHCWLQKQHITDKYLAAVKRMFQSEILQHKVMIVKIIVQCFANLTRSNGLIESPSDRIQVSVAMLTMQERLHKLCDAVTKAKVTDQSWKEIWARHEQSSSVVLSVGGQSSHTGDSWSEQNNESVWFSLTEEQNTEDLLETETFKKLLFFEWLKQRSNMHVDLHYRDVTDEYENSCNCDIFIRENRHRLVHLEKSNHRNIVLTAELDTSKTWHLTQMWSMFWKYFWIRRILSRLYVFF